MPVVKPISDLQRNSGAIAESYHKTKEPVYLTKNGSASLVVMDAEAYDEQTRALTAIQEREDRIQRSIAHGYDDLTNGRVRPWKQAKAEADRMLAPSQAPPPCHHPVNQSGAVEFYRDTVAPGAPLC